jgi:tRNA pseudouridine13 synthase
LNDQSYPPGECSPVTGDPLRRALGEPDAEGTIRADPADFAVDEILGFEPDGEGPHTLLQVRATRVNSQWAASRIARTAGVPARDVGFCGLKDREAVTTQWFSVPGEFPDAAPGLADDGIEVLHSVRHRRKLRRGSHAANAFRIVIRDVTGPREAIDERLGIVAERGVPNYFGPQRFGRNGGNLTLSTRLAEGNRLDRRRRGFALSAARAAIFNELLTRRVAAGAWSEFSTGDVALLDGSASWFVVDDADDALAARLADGDIHPSGPMWGEGVPPVSGQVLVLETAIAQALPDCRLVLESAGLRQERRSLRLLVRELNWEWEGIDLRISFRLPRGAFATAVLAEVVRPVRRDTAQDEILSST